MKEQDVLDLALEVGADMLRSGAEIYRVEQSISYICRAYGMTYTDVFAIPSSIVVTVTKNGQYYTKSRRVAEREINLGKLDQLNTLSRYLCNHTPEREEAFFRLGEIKQQKGFSSWLLILFAGIIGCTLTALFGGDLIDCLWAFPVAILMKATCILTEKYGGNFLFMNIIGGLVTTAAAECLGMLGLVYNTSAVTVGVLMNLVPGIALTNGMRDMIGGDFNAALHRFLEALLVSTGIAVGAAVVLLLIN